MKKLFLLAIFCLYSVLTYSETFAPDTSYYVCFTPSQDCTSVIVHAINQAGKEVLVQAYSFTSAPIAKALVNAANRGVDVKVILDKSQFKQKGYSSSKFFINHHIPIWIDDKPNIAHNKIMILDDKTVITGSFNFTRAAQERNTENVLIISDPQLASKYKENWRNRLQESRKSDRSHAKEIKHEKDQDLLSNMHKIINDSKKFLRSINLY